VIIGRKLHKACLCRTIFCQKLELAIKQHFDPVEALQNVQIRITSMDLKHGNGCVTASLAGHTSDTLLYNVAQFTDVDTEATACPSRINALYDVIKKKQVRVSDN